MHKSKPETVKSFYHRRCCCCSVVHLIANANEEHLTDLTNTHMRPSSSLPSINTNVVYTWHMCTHRVLHDVRFAASRALTTSTHFSTLGLCVATCYKISYTVLHAIRAGVRIRHTRDDRKGFPVAFNTSTHVRLI